MDILDAYFKKDITYNYRNRNLTFHVSHSLFSSHEIDLGTKHLLQTISTEGPESYKKVLDLGCGVGLIGTSLGSACPSAEIHMVDKDALALEFSRQNAKLNGVTDAIVYGSLGYDDVSETDFDLIVSNIPAKVGEKVLSHILEDARYYIRPEGCIVVVVIDAIGDYVTNVLKSNKNINTLFYKRWPGYLVFRYQFSQNNVTEAKPKLGAFDRGLYNLGRKDIFVGSSKILVETTHDLPEFDTLSYETELLLKKMNNLRKQKIGKAIIFNSGQGLIPSALSVISKVEQIVLVDRNLQALKTSKENLILNGYLPEKILLFHEIDFSKVNEKSADFIVGILNEKDGFKVHSRLVEEATGKLADQGMIILASDSTPITRLENYVCSERLLRLVERQKFKGKSLLVMKQKD